MATRFSENKCVIYIIASLQWNLIIKRSDITRPSNNKVILLVPALCISLVFFYRLATRTKKFESTSPALQTLHWLRI